MSDLELSRLITERIQERMGYTQPSVADVIVELLHELGIIS